MRTPLANVVVGLMQKVAIVLLVLMCSIILYKGYVDISALAQKHSGQQFWVELARYFFGNLAGGGKPPEDGKTPGTMAQGRPIH
jgi:hypothetical protein